MIEISRIYYVFEYNPSELLRCRRVDDYPKQTIKLDEEYEVYQMDFGRMPPKLAAEFCKYSDLTNVPNVFDMLMMARQYLPLIDHGPVPEKLNEILALPENTLVYAWFMRVHNVMNEVIYFPEISKQLWIQDELNWEVYDKDQSLGHIPSGRKTTLKEVKKNILKYLKKTVQT